MLKITRLRFVTTLALSAGLTFLGGCAGAKYTPDVAAGALPKPDVIVVENFAVTSAEVTLDEGLMASAMRDSDPGKVTDEENRVGHLVADELAKALVEELNKAGIHAVRATGAGHGTATTAFLRGQFITVNQGNQSARVWVGFGLGSSKIATRLQVIQNGKLVAAGETESNSDLKPGMAVSLATGEGAAVAVGAATTGFSEAFRATVTADAQRTAKEIVKKTKKGYEERGWL